MILSLKSKELLCPRCELPMSEHIEGECRKYVSRRFFLGASGSAFAAAATAKVFKNVDVLEPEAGNLIATATPKVHRAATITITYQGDQKAEHQNAMMFAESLGRQTKKSVVITHNGDVAGYFNPHENQA